MKPRASFGVRGSMFSLATSATAATLLLLCAFQAGGDELRGEAWVKKQAFKVATRYARSISCETVTNLKNMVALIPWKNLKDDDERDRAQYALVWYGDIGCSGGTGSSASHIAIVRISVGDSFLVDPAASSPIVKFDLSVESRTKVLSASSDQLTLSGWDYGPEDAHCCPSVPVRISVKRDQHGNWAVINKTPAAH